MIRYFVIFSLFLLTPFSFLSAFGIVDDFTTDQSVYYEGDTMYISGNVSSDSDAPHVSITVFNPSKAFFVTLGFTTANDDGSFSSSIVVGGPKWSVYGLYPIQVTSENTSLEKLIEYKEDSTKIPTSTTEPATPEPKTPEPTTSESVSATPASPEPASPEPVSTAPASPEPVSPEPASTFPTLKLKIPNFPSLDKSPQYYIDRYNSEPDYKAWFDSQFPSNSITDVVGYKSTSLVGFPSLEQSPQYYIDRYSEPDYKAWFDSNFPDTSIYNILSYEDPVPIPDWVRTDAELWTRGDSDFVSGIEFMIQNNIIMTSSIPSSEDISDADIPYWIRNTALWWSQGLISEDEFVNSIEFLLEEKIITVN